MNRSKYALICCIFLFWTLNSTAQKSTPESFEADSLMKTADVYFRSGDYQNALKSCHLALMSYNRTKDDWGVKRAEGVIFNMESILSSNQLAEIYYNIAGSYYLLDSGNIDGMYKAIYFAEKAKKLYQSIGGTVGSSGLLKSEDILNGARKNIESGLNVCIRDAEEQYQNAQTQFFNGNFLKAQIFVTNASAKFISCPYQPGIDKSSELLTSVNSKINTLRAEAKAAYDQAIKAFTQEDYERCVLISSDAKRLYDSIADKEGSISSTSISTQCQERIDNKKDFMRRQADQYKKEAEFFSVIPDCVNATDRAQKAKGILDSMRNEAYEKEKELPVNQRLETRFYESLLMELDAVFKRITTVCTELNNEQTAEEYYRKAQDHYLNNELSDAKSYAENARRIFASLNKFVGLSKTETLLNQINLKSSQMTDADEAMKNAYLHYSVANFNEAIFEVNKANAIYTNIKKGDKAAEAQALIENIKLGMGKLEQANNLFGKSREYMGYDSFDNALAAATNSYTLYKEINYSLGVNESSKLIQIANERIEEKNHEFMMMILFIAAIVVIPGLALYQVMRRRKNIEFDLERRKADQEDMLRRERDMMDLQSKQETKERVDDELKKLIEQERAKNE
ncbi:MAG: hypothetical protein KKD39_05755 [Candidatus Altiarchaeota archaeon]|nr:hypothetical protein [Candidatus Altiarchaeota archaeon]